MKICKLHFNHLSISFLISPDNLANKVTGSWLQLVSHYLVCVPRLPVKLCLLFTVYVGFFLGGNTGEG